LFLSPTVISQEEIRVLPDYAAPVGSISDSSDSGGSHACRNMDNGIDIEDARLVIAAKGSITCLEHYDYKSTIRAAFDILVLLRKAHSFGRNLARIEGHARRAG